ncbi:hypothetical protein VTK73DRAFT_5662 [Phialemonium thermophilum]|uniref:Uncharacterized protein n=1 Tax=Phialemonium thermophilum TaxID=223376 RepID=A0ABR3WMD7_9PEZI
MYTYNNSDETKIDRVILRLCKTGPDSGWGGTDRLQVQAPEQNAARKFCCLRPQDLYRKSLARAPRSQRGKALGRSQKIITLGAKTHGAHTTRTLDLTPSLSPGTFWCARSSILSSMTATLVTHTPPALQGARCGPKMAPNFSQKASPIIKTPSPFPFHNPP